MKGQKTQTEESSEKNFIDGIGFWRIWSQGRLKQKNNKILVISEEEKREMTINNDINPVPLLKKYIYNLKTLPLKGHYSANKRSYILYAENVLNNYLKNKKEGRGNE